MDNITMDNGKWKISTVESKKMKVGSGQLPNGWVVKKLVDVCVVERGSSPRPIKKYLTDDEDGVNWIKIGDTKNIEKYIYKTNQKITKEGAKKSRFVEEGDFILSNSMSYGKPYILKTKGYIHDGWFKLKLHDFVDTEYFYQLLSSPLVNDQFKNLASGSVVKNISGDLVKKVVLPIPPLTQQKQIVKILDQAFTAIDKAKNNAQQNLLNAKQLFESYLQNVFVNKGNDWVEKSLAEVCIVERGSSPRPIKKYLTDDEDGVNWIKIGDTKNIEKYIYKTNQKITKEGAKKSRFVEEGDFILSNSMSYGKPYILKTKGYIHDGWFKLKLHDFVDAEYFYQLLSSPLVNDQFKNLASGSVVKNISGDLVKKVVLPIPPLTQQQKIVKKLNALQSQTKKLESIYEQKIIDLEELKKSILQKAFSGALTN